MKALIFENKVVDLSENAFPVAESLRWMDAPEGCEVGWILMDGQLKPKPKPQKTQDELIEEYKNAMQSHINTKAAEKNYENGFACASYVASTNLTWKEEAQAFIAWRDQCWQYAINIESQVKDGLIARPSLEDFINNAPVLNWS